MTILRHFSHALWLCLLLAVAGCEKAQPAQFNYASQANTVHVDAKINVQVSSTLLKTVAGRYEMAGVASGPDNSLYARGGRLILAEDGTYSLDCLKVFGVNATELAFDQAGAIQRAQMAMRERSKGRFSLASERVIFRTETGGEFEGRLHGGEVQIDTRTFSKK